MSDEIKDGAAVGSTELLGRWVSYTEITPRHEQIVLACYPDVWGPLVCEFWFDLGGNPHFSPIGSIPESRPAKFWMPIPDTPNANLTGKQKPGKEVDHV